MEPQETYAGADGITEEEGGETRQGQGKHWMVQTCELSTSFKRSTVSFSRNHFLTARWQGKMKR